MVKVYKLYKLGKNGSKFDPTMKSLKRSQVVIEDHVAASFNEETANTGLLYEVDEKKTAAFVKAGESKKKAKDKED